MRVLIPDGEEGYALFMKVRELPQYRFDGCFAEFPDEYASVIDKRIPKRRKKFIPEFNRLFDYQRDITALATRRKKFAVFADCGLGKSLMEFEFMLHAHEQTGKACLLITPAMVVNQMQAEFKTFYNGDLKRIKAAELPGWLDNPSGLAVTNWDALKGDLDGSKLGAIVADESSMLKSHYGAWAGVLIQMGRRVEYKLCATGTPAPNDRIEFANHAVFLDQARTVNEFLARYFVNKGQTQERWVIKPHAVKPFYRGLSHWSIFLSNPATYGWKDNVGTLPPINIHIHDVEMADYQIEEVQKLTGELFVTSSGGITKRSKLARIAKSEGGNKLQYIADLVSSFGDESTIIWCRYNQEQEQVEKAIGDCVGVTGDDDIESRIERIEAFKGGSARVLVTKPKILGFGLNLQVCTRQVFSTCQDSYEEFYQAVKRSNRIGSTKPLNVHIPVTEIERPMMENVLRKSKRVEADTAEQEALFKEAGYAW